LRLLPVISGVRLLENHTVGYNNNLAERLRATLAGYSGLEERRMFGGLAFLLRGNMCCGVVGEDVVVRVGPEEYRAALSEPHTRKMDFTGTPLKGFVYVSPKGVASDQNLRYWVGRAVRFAASLPTKGATQSTARRKRQR